ncbi:oxidoreductase [candidate division KSB1 bacterium]|nr:oxidoreductase [candidate division KSB1 bacterium]
MKLMLYIILIIANIFLMISCGTKNDVVRNFTGANGEIKLLTIHPGHFHAALVQKTMYDQISPEVYVYAPLGPDVEDHLNRIEDFNSRKENPTNWREVVYTGEDFLEKMLKDKKGNVLVTSGNNEKKIIYIKAAIDAGINVLADKPMCINENGFNLLKQAFVAAEKNGVLLYDIMTERSEITTILQKELSLIPDVFGELTEGTPENPAIVKESVHHFFKYVAGNPVKRPAWFFDVTQEGEGIVDVTTHLIDLVQWECFPEQIINYETEIQIINTKHWPTYLSLSQFKQVTHLPQFPEYLSPLLQDDILPVYCNGEIVYKIKGFHAKVSVVWNYQAPEGAKDTHYSVMRGSNANLVILQGKEQNYKPELYVETVNQKNTMTLEHNLKKAVHTLQKTYPGIGFIKCKEKWHITIPNELRVGHEAHFSQVTERYLNYLVDGKLPDWEIPNMIAKYYITTTALKMAKNVK